MSIVEPMFSPETLSDAALLAAWEALEPDEGDVVSDRAKALLAEIEKRGLDI